MVRGFGLFLLLLLLFCSTQVEPLFGLPCPSLNYFELCSVARYAVPLTGPLISDLTDKDKEGPRLQATTLTVKEIEAFLIRATDLGQFQPQPPAELNALFLGLGLSFDLWSWGESSSTPEAELSLGLGNIAALEARLDFFATLIGLMLEKLGGPPLPEGQELNLVLKLEDLRLAPGVLLGGRSRLTLDKDLNFYVDQITLTLTTGPLRSETEVNPEGFVITEERLGVEFELGPISITSGIAVGPQGVTREIIRLSASTGELSLVSEASFTTGLGEFRIGATIGSLELSSASVLTPIGLGSQTFQLRVEF
ncbi:MAG: hypothetical protein ACUVRH_02885 [Candidatus Bipolaricaulia bacterium]